MNDRCVMRPQLKALKISQKRYLSNAGGEEYSGQMIMNIERERIRASPNSTSRLLGVVGIDFPIFGDFGEHIIQYTVCSQ
jgi:hypothetical protein